MGRDLGDPPYSPEQLASLIDDVPDFPKKGVVFKDITTLFQNPALFRRSGDLLADLCRGRGAASVGGTTGRARHDDGRRGGSKPSRHRI